MTMHPDPEALDAAALELMRSTLPFDICCTRALPEHGTAGRCQLWAGHEADHAVMLARDGNRVVRTWHGQDPGTAHDCADYQSLPWARGFPLPAWHESSHNDG
jgi:hypothetical protein